MSRVVVIGGGPAGMMAAGRAASRDHQVCLVEKMHSCGLKLMITGQGRCNLTNQADPEEIIAMTPRNGKFLYSALYQFTSQQLIAFFRELGLETMVERGGRVFPLSERAEDVVLTLERYLQAEGVSLERGRASEIVSNGNRVLGVRLEGSRRLEAEAVILATGGLSYPRTGSTGDGFRMARKLGHKVVAPSPSLVPMEVEEEWVQEAAGLRLKNVGIKIYDRDRRVIHEDFGELTLEDYGVSGPVILTASSYLEDFESGELKLIIDLKPALDDNKLDRRIQRDFNRYNNRQFKNSLIDLLPGQLISPLLQMVSISPQKSVNQISREERRELARVLKGLSLTLKAFRPLSEAIVTSGGIEVSEIDPQTMESRLVDGLYFAGEIIDVDALTGGYNLQLAFATGHLAGSSVGR